MWISCGKRGKPISEHIKEFQYTGCMQISQPDEPLLGDILWFYRTLKLFNTITISQAFLQQFYDSLLRYRYYCNCVTFVYFEVIHVFFNLVQFNSNTVPSLDHNQLGHFSHVQIQSTAVSVTSQRAKAQRLKRNVTSFTL